MHFIAAMLAQGTAEAVAGNPLYIYGPLGVICGWFMWRYEKHSEALRSEVRAVRHGQKGLEIAFWSFLSTQRDSPVYIKEHARRIIERNNSDPLPKTWDMGDGPTSQ